MRHLVDEGTPVPVGDPIAVIGEEGEEVDVAALTGGEAEPAAKEQPAAKADSRRNSSRSRKKAPAQAEAAIAERPADQPERAWPEAEGRRARRRVAGRRARLTGRPPHG